MKVSLMMAKFNASHFMVHNRLKMCFTVIELPTLRDGPEIQLTGYPAHLKSLVSGTLQNQISCRISGRV